MKIILLFTFEYICSGEFCQIVNRMWLVDQTWISFKIGRFATISVTPCVSLSAILKQNHEYKFVPVWENEIELQTVFKRIERVRSRLPTSGDLTYIGGWRVNTWIAFLIHPHLFIHFPFIRLKSSAEINFASWRKELTCFFF